MSADFIMLAKHLNWQTNLKILKILDAIGILLKVLRALQNPRLYSNSQRDSHFYKLENVREQVQDDREVDRSVRNSFLPFCGPPFH